MKPRKKRAKRFGTQKRLLHINTFYHYNKKRIIPQKYRVDNYQEFSDILKDIFTETANRFVWGKAGVVLKGIGYFAIVRQPKKTFYNVWAPGGIKKWFSYHTDGYRYVPVLFSNVFRNNRLVGWNMEGLFTQKVKQGIKKYLYSGRKYKLFISLVLGIYQNKGQILKIKSYDNLRFNRGNKN